MRETAQTLFQTASKLSREGRINEALTQLEKAIASDQRQPEAVLMAGILMGRNGRYAEAIPLLQRALSVEPRPFLAAYWLSHVHQKNGNRDDALRYAQLAVSLNPKDPACYERLAYCHMEADDFLEAEANFLIGLRIQPNNAALIGGLGSALERQGKVSEAIGLFQRATQVDPQSATSYSHLARLLNEVQDTTEALAAAKKAVFLKPTSDEARQSLVSALLQSGDGQEACRHLINLTQTGKATPKLFAFIGWAWQALGDNSKAREAFDRALELDPLEPEACLESFRRRRLTMDDLPLIERLEVALRGDSASFETQKCLSYALGKAFEDLGRYEESMEHYDRANRISQRVKFGDATFDSALSKANDHIFISRFTCEFVESHRAFRSTGVIPVFVIGMMRSGTTLAEQILACHNEVAGGGEIRFWTKNRRRAFEEPLALRSLGDEYREQLRAKSAGKRFVVDKMPTNYTVLPLIHLALPDARIIHIERHPIDTAVSIWTTPNVARIDWAHEKASIVFAYEQYRLLMQAWREALPEGAMLEIRYEDLVTNPEPAIRQMLDFVGLEWDEACMSPHASSASVTTPSAWQVRQPVYTSSIGRWKHFEPWLGEFRRLLS